MSIIFRLCSALALVFGAATREMVGDVFGACAWTLRLRLDPLLMQPAVSEATKHVEELSASGELAAAFEAFDAAIRSI